MKYEVRLKRGHLPSSALSEWVADAYDLQERVSYTAIFSGPNARDRAEEYAAWQNSKPAPPRP